MIPTPYTIFLLWLFSLLWAPLHLYGLAASSFFVLSLFSYLHRLHLSKICVFVQVLRVDNLIRVQCCLLSISVGLPARSSSHLLDSIGKKRCSRLGWQRETAVCQRRSAWFLEGFLSINGHCSGTPELEHLSYSLMCTALQLRSCLMFAKNFSCQTQLVVARPAD